MPLINRKVELSLKWYENCILSSAGTAATFTITDLENMLKVMVFCHLQENLVISMVKSKWIMQQKQE